MAIKTKDVEVPKTVVLSWEGTDYTIEYDRDSVSRIERGFGVTVEDIQKGSITAFQSIFFGGFFKHHPNIKKSTLEQLYDATPDKMELFKVLVEMYMENVNSLIDEPAEGKALSWSVR